MAGAFSTGALTAQEVNKNNPFNIILGRFQEAQARRYKEDQDRKKEEAELSKTLQVLGIQHTYDQELKKQEALEKEKEQERGFGFGSRLETQKAEEERKTELLKGEEARKTGIVTETEKRKSDITAAMLKGGFAPTPSGTTRYAPEEMRNLSIENIAGLMPRGGFEQGGGMPTKPEAVSVGEAGAFQPFAGVGETVTTEEEIKSWAWNQYQSGNKTPEILKVLGMYVSPKEAMLGSEIGLGGGQETPPSFNRDTEKQQSRINPQTGKVEWRVVPK